MDAHDRSFGGMAQEHYETFLVEMLVVDQQMSVVLWWSASRRQQVAQLVVEYLVVPEQYSYEFSFLQNIGKPFQQGLVHKAGVI